MVSQASQTQSGLPRPDTFVIAAPDGTYIPLKDEHGTAVLLSIPEDFDEAIDGDLNDYVKDCVDSAEETWCLFTIIEALIKKD